MKHYILVDGKPVLGPDLITWAEWFETADRTVVKTDISPTIHVSTVFLGLDHNYFGGKPLLWETMIFGGPHDQYQERYASEEEARIGHAKACRIARGEEVEP